MNNFDLESHNKEDFSKKFNIQSQELSKEYVENLLLDLSKVHAENNPQDECSIKPFTTEEGGLGFIISTGKMTCMTGVGGYEEIMKQVTGDNNWKLCYKQGNKCKYGCNGICKDDEVNK